MTSLETCQRIGQHRETNINLRSHQTGHLKLPVNLMCRLLHCGRNLERRCADTRSLFTEHDDQFPHSLSKHAVWRVPEKKNKKLSISLHMVTPRPNWAGTPLLKTHLHQIKPLGVHSHCHCTSRLHLQSCGWTGPLWSLTSRGDTPLPPGASLNKVANAARSRIPGACDRFIIKSAGQSITKGGV